MFVTLKDFVSEWKNESTATQRVMDTLTDASLGQAVTPDHRTLGQIGWHLVTTIHEMLTRTGLEFQPPDGDEHAPASAAVIAEAYKRTSTAMLDALQTQWTDETLGIVTNMYGEEWPNGLTLRLLIQHEIHHRGQMTILMRQAGLRVPDFYGPTREVWLEQGMQPLV
ncbi:DinB family protein [Paenibacillus tarimensis]